MKKMKMMKKMKKMKMEIMNKDMDAELANWHDDIMHDIVVADMLRGASPEEAIEFGQFAEECLVEFASDVLKAEIDRKMIGLLKQNKKKVKCR